MPLNSSAGNWASVIFVSWRQRTSGCTASSHSSTLGIRALSELTFQVAISTGRIYAPAPGPVTRLGAH